MSIISNFWQAQLQLLESSEVDFKNHQLPLARIKKVMKTDDDVKQMMISAEAPIIFAKACEIFILELTLRSWIHTEESKRRTLQKSDVASAVSKNDMFDFLIDIVPRDEYKGKKAEMDYGPNPNFYYSSPLNMQYAAPGADLAGNLVYQPGYAGQYGVHQNGQGDAEEAKEK